MKTGVSTFPRASSRVAARAAPSVAWIVNFIELASQLRPPLSWGEGRGGGRSEQTFLLGFLAFGFRLLDPCIRLVTLGCLVQALAPFLSPGRFVERRRVREFGEIAFDCAWPLRQLAQPVSTLQRRRARKDRAPAHRSMVSDSGRTWSPMGVFRSAFNRRRSAVMSAQDSCIASAR